MSEVNKSFHPDEIDVSISEISNGIYRISGFVETYGITFNQFLIQDECPNPNSYRTHRHVQQNRGKSKGSY